MQRVSPGRGMRDWATEFFAGDSLKRVLTYLCNARAPGAWDPITATVVDLLTGRLQLTLTPAGLLPFKGKTALVYPYHMMSPAQKELPRGLLEDRSSFVVCSDSVVFHWREGDPERLDPVPVLLGSPCHVPGRASHPHPRGPQGQRRHLQHPAPARPERRAHLARRPAGAQLAAVLQVRLGCCLVYLKACCLGMKHDFEC